MTIETANRLYELRKAHNLSQEELAERLGVSRQAVSKWERSESSPDTDNLIALARLYNLTLDELVYGKAEKSACPNEKAMLEDMITYANAIGVQIDADNPNASVTYEEKDGTCKLTYENKSKKARLNRFLYEVPYPLFCTVLYLLLGCIDEWGGWGKAWIVFVSIPVYYSVVDAVVKKRFVNFLYPVFCTVVYLYLGMYHSLWHPAWLVYVTIPAYYAIADAIDKYNGLPDEDDECEDQP